MSALVAGAPVRPGREEARRLLAEELAGREYRQDGASWLVRAWEWLVERFSAVEVPAVGTGLTAVLVVVLLVVAVVVVVLLVAGPVRRGGRAPRAELFEAGPEPSSAHVRRADAAAAAGAWDAAVAERFRALVRSLEERALLDRRPGRTAHEAAVEAAAALPGCADGLARAARAFDDVRYGGRPASAATDADLRAVLAQVAAARPLPPPGAGPDGGAGAGGAGGAGGGPLAAAGGAR
ncbi:DUF4129 domain-containing protein [Kineococcus gypseus]|uniref:DUF4129 domain-containing protein n=1 Tax=Kineococcus gypseus TaxID=1637102 RepID=UPI003D7E299F